LSIGAGVIEIVVPCTVLLVYIEQLCQKKNPADSAHPEMADFTDSGMGQKF
jgi:hypothetical protein